MDINLFAPINKKYFILSFLYATLVGVLIIALNTAITHPTDFYERVVLNLKFLTSTIFLISLTFSIVLHFKKPWITVVSLSILAIIFNIIFFRSAGPAALVIFLLIPLTIIGILTSSALAFMARRLLRIKFLSIGLIILLPLLLLSFTFYKISSYNPKNLTIERCISLKEVGAKIDCYNTLALETNNASYCFYIQDYASNIAKNCFDNISAKTNLSYQATCDSLKNNAYETCVWVFAIKNHDPLICSNLKNTNSAENCANYAIKPNAKFW